MRRLCFIGLHERPCRPSAGAAIYRARALLTLILLSVAASLTLSGCISSKMYRPVNVKQEQGYTLAIVEFDDQGELWAPPQVSRTLDAIEQANEAEAGSVVIVFVHGWNNNASEKHEQKEGYSLYEFKQFLNLIRDSRQQRSGSAKTAALVGVFVAWRGKSALGPLHPFTFYGRQRAATRIASGPTAVDAVTRIVRKAKGNPKSKVLLIGHSFGGWIMERSLSQLIVRGAAAAEEQTLNVQVDLALLVNPASPSLEAKQVIEVLARERFKVYRVDADGNRFERPLLISLTSKADSATRVLYPVGRSLGALTSRFRDYGVEFCSPTASQRGFYVYTPGHRTSLHSHIVTAEPLPDGAQPSDRLRYADDPRSKSPAISFDGPKHRFTLRRLPLALNDTPYWIARVPGSLISSHADIFNAGTLRLLAVLLQHTGALLPDSTTILTHETGLRAVGLAVRPSGELLFVDRSRRLFALPKGSDGPIFLACLPPGFDPSHVIGGFRQQDTAMIIQNRELEKGEKQGYRTELVALGTEAFRARKVKPVRFAGEQRFIVATGDGASQKVYLATQNEIYVADLSKTPPQPEPFLRIDTPGQLDRLLIDPTRQRLLALDARAGRLYLVDLTAPPLQPRLAVEGLGGTFDLEVHADSGRIYVSHPQGKQIWQITCEGSQCNKRIFVRSDAFQRPTAMAVSPDGTLWVSDVAAGRLFAFSPDGRVQRTLSSLVGTH